MTLAQPCTFSEGLLNFSIEMEICWVNKQNDAVDTRIAHIFFLAVKMMKRA